MVYIISLSWKYILSFDIKNNYKTNKHIQFFSLQLLNYLLKIDRRFFLSFLEYFVSNKLLFKWI